MMSVSAMVRALEAQEQTQGRAGHEQAHGHELQPFQAADDGAERHCRQAPDGHAEPAAHGQRHHRADGAPDREGDPVEADVAGARASGPPMPKPMAASATMATPVVSTR